MLDQGSFLQLDKGKGTCGENGDVTEVEALDLTSFVLDLFKDLSVDVERRQHK